MVAMPSMTHYSQKVTLLSSISAIGVSRTSKVDNILFYKIDEALLSKLESDESIALENTYVFSIQKIEIMRM